MTAATETSIAGRTVNELADLFLQYVKEEVNEALEFHKDDEGFQSDAADGIPAEIMNTAEAEAWNLLRTEFSAFGLDAEAEDKIAEIVETRRAE